MSLRTPTDGQAWRRRWRRWQRSLGLAGGEHGSVQVKRLEILSGCVTATVQSRGAPPCEVTVAFRTWTDEEWQLVVDALSSQALFAAQLLAGDLPPDMDRALTEAGVDLLPERLDEIEHRCTCSATAGRPCEHIGAVYSSLGDLLADDPWLFFRLRGRERQGLLRGLRNQRSRENGSATNGSLLGNGRSTGDGAGFYRAAGAETHTEEIPPLDEQLTGFWGSTKPQADFRPQIVAPVVELALLRRLGAPPLQGADAETYDDLAGLYRRISQNALTIAFAADPEPDEEGGA